MMTIYLFNVIEKAIVESGCKMVLSNTIDELPFQFQIQSDQTFQHVNIYVWELKFNCKGEFQLQVSSENHFEPLPESKTLILGWWREAEVFAGFDARKYLRKLRKLPSIQIREDALRKAYVNGFEPCDKGNEEVAIAFRPDFFVEYLKNLESLHDFGQSAQDFAVLSQVAENPEINDADITIQDTARKTTIVSVSKKLRDVSFRRRVLTAYGFRCAVCGIQLKLVEAAHIVPVNHDKSTDETRNGLALCALHHKAYDQALITIKDDYSILLNRGQATELQKQKLAEGLIKFQQDLRPMIILPPAISDRPHSEYVRIANDIRGWKNE